MSGFAVMVETSQPGRDLSLEHCSLARISMVRWRYGKIGWKSEKKRVCERERGTKRRECICVFAREEKIRMRAIRTGGL